jgi:uncharacterized protein with ParB-like and HNH nuclease domain
LLEVGKGNIRIPEFQRDFVWNKTKMLKLASSLLKAYPIGSFLLNALKWIKSEYGVLGKRYFP